MKAAECTEFWYAAFLALAACLMVVPTSLYSYRTFADGGHDAMLGWPFAITALLLWSWAAWCCYWELLLLQMRRREPNRSETLSLLVFCSGIIAFLLTLWIIVAP